MRAQVNGFQSDMARFQRMTESHFSEADRERNYMPWTFIVRPKTFTTEDLPVSAATASVSSSSWMGYIKKQCTAAANFATRQFKRAVRLGWQSSEVVFVCPVTLRPVPGAVFEISLPTQTMKNLAWGMKWGAVVVKIALASQV